MSVRSTPSTARSAGALPPFPVGFARNVQAIGGKLGGAHLFTDVKPDPERERELNRYGYTMTPHLLLREIDTNQDVWDTLTPEVVKMMMNPPETYDAQYQKTVNIAMLSVLAALSRR